MTSYTSSFSTFNLNSIAGASSLQSYTTTPPIFISYNSLNVGNSNTSNYSILLNPISPYRIVSLEDDLASIFATNYPYGVYYAGDIGMYSNNILPDRSSNHNHATITGSGYSLSNIVSNGSLNQCYTLFGTASSIITWGTNSIPVQFTICSITTYVSSTSTNKTILCSTGGTFIHGHNNGMSGYGNYYGINKCAGTAANYKYTITCGNNSNSSPLSTSNFIVNNKPSCLTAGGTVTADNRLSINGYATTAGNFGFTYLIIWASWLSDGQMQLVNNAFTKFIYNNSLILNPPLSIAGNTIDIDTSSFSTVAGLTTTNTNLATTNTNLATTNTNLATTNTNLATTNTNLATTTTNLATTNTNLATTNTNLATTNTKLDTTNTNLATTNTNLATTNTNLATLTNAVTNDINNLQNYYSTTAQMNTAIASTSDALNMKFNSYLTLTGGTITGTTTFYTKITGSISGNCDGSSGSCTGNAATSTVSSYTNGLSTGFRFPNDLWILSIENKSRFFFGNNGRTYYGSGNGYEFRNTNDSPIFRINNDGSVLSTGSIIVNGYSDYSFQSQITYYLQSGVSFSTGISGSYSIQSYTANIASIFIVHSDIRIKKNIDLINKKYIELFYLLKPVEYYYIDNINHGTKKQYGFIADEIYNFFPDSIDSITSYIPNIYEKGSYNNNIITFNNTSNIILNINDKIKICNDIDNNLCEYIITSNISSNQFIIDKTLNSSNIFIYGTEVNDFKSLNYHSIFTLNVAATHELKKEVEQLKKENEMLNNKLNKLLNILKINLDDI